MMAKTNPAMYPRKILACSGAPWTVLQFRECIPPCLLLKRQLCLRRRSSCVKTLGRQARFVASTLLEHWETFAQLLLGIVGQSMDLKRLVPWPTRSREITEETIAYTNATLATIWGAYWSRCKQGDGSDIARLAVNIDRWPVWRNVLTIVLNLFTDNSLQLRMKDWIPHPRPT